MATTQLKFNINMVEAMIAVNFIDISNEFKIMAGFNFINIFKVFAIIRVIFMSIIKVVRMLVGHIKKIRDIENFIIINLHVVKLF